MNEMVAVRMLIRALDAVEAAGVPRRVLLEDLGVSEEALQDPDAEVPQSLLSRAWKRAVELTENEALGLLAGQQVDRGYFGVVDYVVRSSSDLGDAMRVAQRYFRLANTRCELRERRSDRHVRFERYIRGDEARVLPRQLADFALAAMVRLFRSACSAAPLHRVSMRWPSPRDPKPYADFFQCEIAFSAPCDALWLPLEALSLPMSAPDPALRALVQRHGDELLQRLPEDPSVGGAVRAQLARGLAGGDVRIDVIARQLGMSRRTLQRGLDAEGLRFAEILQTLRSELACAYLQAGMSQAEASLLLGYSEVSAFNRAFRSWTGVTPGRWISTHQR